ncbi:MAG: hypothetical protein NC038_04985 [Paludibacter sp.]|nr:hypothetical protein [Bacteroidales bacterium]MCM1068337.1 hypothetical protein [Prevotella sp.]MCM1354035.1 hypothetical protein [Bacteroides sp.]MCM1442123.1 hypothetical protein [Muribaculum sp.]MCM1481984.1 hypothetical protein [Paludibacter sp.]
MIKRLLHIGAFLLCCSVAGAWDFWPLPMAEPDVEEDSLMYGVSLSGLASTGRYTPFLLQSNRNGNISLAPYSGNLSVCFAKRATRPHRWYDYDFGVAYTLRLDPQRFNYYFNQLYAHVRLYVFDITAGITPYIHGPQDPELSSGGMLFSTNAQPFPRVTVGIDRYTAFPGLYGFVEVKGGITHGWFIDNVYVRKSFLHHAFAGVRAGGELPFNVAYEFHHVAQWGGHSPVFGDLGNNFKSFWNAVTAHSGGSMANDLLNAQGNHIGWQILDVDIKGSNWKASVYWQNIFEDGPVKFLSQTMNRYDGLWGINISQSEWPFINGITYEFLNTTDQSGPYHDKDGFVYGGNDSYFRNYIYANGWNYFYRTIGTPYITSPLYNEDGTTQTLNNRVKTYFAGVKGDIYGYRYRLMASYTRNYGQYSQPLSSDNTALLIEVTKQFERAWGLEVSLSLSADIGSQFGNSFGAMLTIAKRGLIYSY